MGQGKIFKCTPCGLACDSKTFTEAGKCPDCNMALQELGAYNFRWPSLSPDGKQLLYTNDSTGQEYIYLSSANGNNKRQMTKGSTPVWSPDGSKIIYIDSIAIVMVESTGDSRIVVSDKFKGEGPQTPAWGADANTILFAQGKFPDINIFRMSLHDYQPIQLTFDAGLKYAPVLSPDGKKIAYTQMRKGIMVLTVGATPVVLTTGGEYPRWSPDGKWIAYQRRVNGKFLISTVSVAGGEPVNLTDGSSDDELPAWSPDGKQIYFQSNRRRGNWELYVMDADGRNQRLVLGNTNP